MGRPRKARKSQPEERLSEDSIPPAAANHLVDMPSLAMAGDHPNSMDLDLDMAFFDVNDMSFFDLLMPNYTNQVPLVPEIFHPSEIERNPTLGVMNGSHLASDINFDEPPPAPRPHAPIAELTNIQTPNVMVNEYPAVLPPNPTNPSFSPGSAPSSSSVSSTGLSPPPITTTTTPSPPPPQPPPCSCLATLYLALDSLRTLPTTSISTALHTARAASRACHDTILCTSCANPPITVHDRTYTPPLASFQSMMMLGAILPTLSNAYRQILDMVDTETSHATCQSRKIPFDLHSYGGLWGVLGASDNICGAADRIQGVLLEPATWRLTVRALLKIDVYGFGSGNVVPPDSGSGPKPCAGGGDDGSGFRRHQPGLKNIIEMMEERSRLRHEALDAMVDRGEVEVDDTTNPCGGYHSLRSDQKPACVRIIDIAKHSMQRLDIP